MQSISKASKSLTLQRFIEAEFLNPDSILSRKKREIRNNFLSNIARGYDFHKPKVPARNVVESTKNTVSHVKADRN